MSDLAAFRGKEPAQPAKGGAPDPIITDTPELDNNTGELRTPAADAADAQNGQQQQQKPAEKKEPLPPPSDTDRMKIFERMSGVRARESDGGEADDPPPADGAASADDNQGHQDGAPSDSRADDSFELVVNGKTVSRSIAEMAELSGLTADEIRAKPEMAKRFAQRELATQANLERSKTIVRNTSARTTDEDADNPPARSSAPNQGENRGADDDDHGQQDDRRDTNGEVDFQKLVEDIQIGDPKEAAEKLKNALSKVAESTSRKSVSEARVQDALATDQRATAAARQAFFKENPDIEKLVTDDPDSADILRSALTAERKVDLRKALLAEGMEPDDVNHALRTATAEEIERHHRIRRITGSPHVRPSSKAFLDAAFSRVAPVFGKPSRQAPQQDFQNTRQVRKDNLRTQPLRSSVPPATNAAEQKPSEGSSRKAAVAEMKAARGGKAR